MAKLPETIKFYCSPVKDNYKIDGVDRWATDVHEAYPVDEKAAQSTHSIAKRGALHYQQYATAIIDTLPNDPIVDTQIIDIEARRNSKIYKVVVHGKYYIDLHLQHLLDLMINGHIENGVIKSPMVFVRCAGGLRLVRVGSAAYDESLKGTKRYTKYIPTQDILEGNVYTSHYYYGPHVFKVSGRLAWVSTTTNVMQVVDGYFNFNPNDSHISYANLRIMGSNEAHASGDCEKITGDLDKHYRDMIKHFSESAEIVEYVKNNDLRGVCRVVAIMNTADSSGTWPSINSELGELYTAFINNRH